MNAVVLLRIAGIVLVLLAIVNLFVPKHCRWADDLPRSPLSHESYALSLSHRPQKWAPRRSRGERHDKRS